MGIKSFKEGGNVGFTKGWQEENSDLMIQCKPNETRLLRFVDLFLPLVTHWVPFLSKKSTKVKFFPQMCLRWDIKASDWDDENECPACERDNYGQEGGVYVCLDVEALFDGQKKVVGLFEAGPRERRKLDGLEKFNKVKGTAYPVGHSRYGRIIGVVHNPNADDKALRWTFNTGERMRVKLLDEGTIIQVKIPEDADSDYAGQIKKFEVPDLLSIIEPPSLAETKSKFKRMKVDDAIDRLDRKDRQESGDSSDDDDDDDRSSRRRGKGRSPRGRDRDDDDDKPRSGRKGRRSRDEDDDDDRSSRRRGKGRRSRDDDMEDGPDDDDFRDDEDDDDKPRGRSGRKGRRSRDEDEDDKPRGRRGRRSRDEDDDEETGGDDWGEDTDEDDDDKPRGRRGKKKGKGKDKPYCFGRIGDDDTEDCTSCPVRDACLAAQEDDDDF